MTKELSVCASLFDPLGLCDGEADHAEVGGSFSSSVGNSHCCICRASDWKVAS